MSDPVAFFGQGTELRIEIDSVFTSIPYLQSISGPSMTTETVDVTTHSSPNGMREYIAGLSDGGELTCTINWNGAEDAHAELQAAQLAREVVNFQLWWPNMTADNLVDFAGFITGLETESPVDAQITRALTVKITGLLEWSTE